MTPTDTEILRRLHRSGILAPEYREPLGRVLAALEAAAEGLAARATVGDPGGRVWLIGYPGHQVGKIEAIKAVRVVTGLRLREVKDLVDAVPVAEQEIPLNPDRIRDRPGQLAVLRAAGCLLRIEEEERIEGLGAALVIDGDEP